MSVIDFLVAPWADVTVVSLFFLVLQLAAVILGVVPAIRRALRASPWVAALVIGTPLLWVLFETSAYLILSGSWGHSNARWLWAGLANYVMVVGTTVILQAVLALQYVDRPLAKFPTLGLVAALLAILGDVLFMVSVLASPVPVSHAISGGGSPSGEAYALLQTYYTGPFLLEDMVRLKIFYGETRVLIATDLTEGPDGAHAEVHELRWLSDHEILVIRDVSGREENVVFDTTTHTWRSP